MKKTLSFTVATALVLSSLLINAKADDFEIIPSVLVREEYNDNIFFTKNDKIDDFITTLAGSLELIERTERVNANLYGRVARFIFSLGYYRELATEVRRPFLTRRVLDVIQRLPPRHRVNNNGRN